MTSMFDQYERASQRSKPSGSELMKPDIVSLILTELNE